MRFTVDISLKGKPPFILPTTYRRNIVNLIKTAVRSCGNICNIYSEYWGNINTNTAKPFTFYLHIPNARYIYMDFRRYLQLNIPSIKLLISSNDLAFLSILYNGLLNINKTFVLFDYPIEFKEFFLNQVDSINSNYVKFKILSPVLVRDIAIEGRNKKCRGYLSCDNPYIADSLAHSIRTLCIRFLNNGYNIKKDDIKIDISNCRAVKVYYYKDVLPGIKGIIGIKASTEILKLIYNTGLGARRSQGFGMLETAREIDINYDRNYARQSQKLIKC